MTVSGRTGDVAMAGGVTSVCGSGMRRMEDIDKGTNYLGFERPPASTTEALDRCRRMNNAGAF
jgi:hypothetical protein